jgi:hypothetical protein
MTEHREPPGSLTSAPECPMLKGNRSVEQRRFPSRRRSLPTAALGQIRDHLILAPRLLYPISRCFQPGSRAIMRRQRLMKIAREIPLPPTIMGPQALDSVREMRDILWRRVGTIASESSADPCELRGRTGDLFIRLTDGVQRFRRRDKFRVCRLVFPLKMPACHPGPPINRSSVIEQRRPPMPGLYIECMGSLCVSARITAERGNP